MAVQLSNTQVGGKVPPTDTLGAVDADVLAWTCVQVTVPPTTELEGVEVSLRKEDFRAGCATDSCGATLRLTVAGGATVTVLDANLGTGKFVLGNCGAAPELTGASAPAYVMPDRLTLFGFPYTRLNVTVSMLFGLLAVTSQVAVTGLGQFTAGAMGQRSWLVPVTGDPPAPVLSEETSTALGPDAEATGAVTLTPGGTFPSTKINRVPLAAKPVCIPNTAEFT
jgi:hypothetical protein